MVQFNTKNIQCLKELSNFTLFYHKIQKCIEDLATGSIFTTIGWEIWNQKRFTKNRLMIEHEYCGTDDTDVWNIWIIT